MSSSRSGAPSGRSGSEPSRDPRDPQRWRSATSGASSQPISDLPALDSLSPAQSSLPPQTSQHTARRTVLRAPQPFPPGDDQISGAAAAQLFGPAPRPTTRQTSAQSSAQTSARISAAPGARPTTPVAATAPAVALADADPGAAPADARQPTLTQQMRSLQPPDVARQALNELSVLAGELSALARDLEQSGLARIHASGYYDVVRRYGALAQRAWLAVAAERLEQDGASPDYRQLVVGIARDITRLRRESAVAASNEQFPLPRRRPYLWRRHTGVISRALRSWQGALGAPVDPQRMGQALFELRGALNSANVAPLESSLLSLLTVAALWLTPLSGVAAGMASIANALTQQPLVAASYALITLLAFTLWTILLLLTSRGRVTLVETLAGVCFSATRSACNGRGGSRGVAVALRIWWLLIGGVGALLTLATFVASGYALDRFGLLAPLVAQAQTHGLPTTTPDLLQMAAGLLAVMAAPAALVATTALVALALPALLLSALRLAAEMTGSRRWVPAARRYALAPALATLSYLTGALVALAWLLAGRLGLAHWPLLSGSLVAGQAHTVIVTISERAPLLALALALPYLALIELPYRLGLGSWRRAWLRDLRTRRTTIEAHVRRLSAPDPRTGAPDTSEETLRAMQYDLVLLQFYTARIAEAERASAAPLSLGATLAVLLIIVVGALLLDGGAHTLAQALTIRLIP